VYVDLFVVGLEGDREMIHLSWYTLSSRATKAIHPRIAQVEI
jgi:hypothetical protein